MEYTVNKLAQLSGVSTRTLHYYDQIGLLKPGRISSNGYRVYGQMQVDNLQQILFYRDLGFSLDDIMGIITAPSFDREKALLSQLASLESKKDQIELLIDNVRKTISHVKGKTTMNDKEKFEGFIKKAAEDNEKTYGKEIRQRFGDSIIDASNRKLAGMSEELWQKQESISVQINELLVKAVKTGDPACAEAQEMCGLHEEWLKFLWPDGTYTKEAHRLLGEAYVSDKRFETYYEKIAVGGAKFMRDALAVYCR